MRPSRTDEGSMTLIRYPFCPRPLCRGCLPILKPHGRPSLVWTTAYWLIFARASHGGVRESDDLRFLYWSLE